MCPLPPSLPPSLPLPVSGPRRRSVGVTSRRDVPTPPARYCCLARRDKGPAVCPSHYVPPSSLSPALVEGTPPPRAESTGVSARYTIARPERTRRRRTTLSLTSRAPSTYVHDTRSMRACGTRDQTTGRCWYGRRLSGVNGDSFPFRFGSFSPRLCIVIRCTGSDQVRRK